MLLIYIHTKNLVNLESHSLFLWGQNAETLLDFQAMENSVELMHKIMKLRAVCKIMRHQKRVFIT